MAGKITINELSASLIQYLKNLIKEEVASSGGGSGGGGGTVTANSVKYLKSSISLKYGTSSITIPTSFNFNTSKDLLMVFKNSTYLEEDYDYTINSSGTTINMMSSNEWFASEDAPDCLFNLIVFKNVAKG